jgi:hypothetical protein
MGVKRGLSGLRRTGELSEALQYICGRMDVVDIAYSSTMSFEGAFVGTVYNVMAKAAPQSLSLLREKEMERRRLQKCIIS